MRNNAPKAMVHRTGRPSKRTRVESPFVPSTTLRNARSAWDPIHVDAPIGTTPVAKTVPVVHDGTSSPSRAPCDGTLGLERFAHRSHGRRADACISPTPSLARRMLPATSCTRFLQLAPCFFSSFLLEARLASRSPSMAMVLVQPPWTVRNHGLYGPRLSSPHETHRSTNGPSSDAHRRHLVVLRARSCTRIRIARASIAVFFRSVSLPGS